MAGEDFPPPEGALSWDSRCYCPRGARPPGFTSSPPLLQPGQGSLGWSSPGRLRDAGARAAAGHQEPIWPVRHHPALLTPECSLELRPAPSTPELVTDTALSRGEATGPLAQRRPSMPGSSQ